MGRVSVYAPTSINTTPEAARRSWFPQGMAENNKMLNIPPACVMAGAFSAELASLKAKTSLTSQCGTMTIEQAFPSVFSISPWNLWAPCTNKNYLRSACTICFRIFRISSCGGRQWCFFFFFCHCLYVQKWQFASFKRQQSSGQWNHRDKRNWLWLYSLEW